MNSTRFKSNIFLKIPSYPYKYYIYYLVCMKQSPCWKPVLRTIPASWPHARPLLRPRIEHKKKVSATAGPKLKPEPAELKDGLLSLWDCVYPYSFLFLPLILISFRTGFIQRGTLCRLFGTVISLCQAYGCSVISALPCLSLSDSRIIYIWHLSIHELQ